MPMKILKIADKKIDERLPDNEALAIYCQTLKMYLKDNPDIDDKYADLIKKLPSPRQIRQDLSIQECKVLYETLEYLWERITKQKIIPDKVIHTAPETLEGCYWMMANGILLHGLNHYSIVKQNNTLFCTILGISGMTMFEYLNSPPDQLIRFIIKNGAMRLLINKNKKLYTQCTPATYGLWAKEKIQKLDFQFKAMKVIDLKTPYEGWKSGILIKL